MIYVIVSFVIAIILIFVTAAVLITIFYKNANTTDTPYNLKKLSKIFSIVGAVLLINKICVSAGAIMFIVDEYARYAIDENAIRENIPFFFTSGITVWMLLLLPLGIIIALISALILRKKEKYKASVAIQALPLVMFHYAVISGIISSIFLILMPI